MSLLTDKINANAAAGVEKQALGLAEDLAWDLGISTLLLALDAARRAGDVAPRLWTLASKDGPDQVSGQFRPENFTWRFGQKVAAEVPQNQDKSISNYTAGEIDELAFQATFYAQHANDFSPRSNLYALYRLCHRNPDLGRPPILLFQVGPDVSMYCLLTSVSAAVIDWRDDGSMRGLRCQLRLQKYDPLDVDTYPAAPPAADQLRVIPAGMNWEVLGWIEYGAAEAGRFLEQYNLDWAVTADGQPLVTSAELRFPPPDQLTVGGDPFSLALTAEGTQSSFLLEIAAHL